MAVIAEELARGQRAAPPRPLGALLGFVRCEPVAAGAALVLLLICLVALLAPLIAPYGPNTVFLRDRLVHPGGRHLLGADELGRDVLTRVIYGARVSLTAGLGATALGVGFGVLFGVISGYAGGLVDQIVQRCMDAIMALPPIILLMVLATTLSPNLRNVIIAIAVFVTPGSARIVRGAVLSVKAMTYVEAAQALGVSPVRVVWRHVLPNVVAPVIVIASITVGSVIIIEAALGFLGLSVHEPTATWGNMLNTGAQAYMEQAPWLALAPGIAIAVTVFAINLFGDGLRDALDPRLRGR
ncbi:MAG TPA: ABC transporter permease [Dehalococcoidia bacterium]|nr:ABC transporter permease [Dehalococcoidia bacterium]